jgi:hypothetical protein
MANDFQHWYNEFLFFAKTMYYLPEKRVNDIKAQVEEYYLEGISPFHAAEQELGWD